MGVWKNHKTGQNGEPDEAADHASEKEDALKKFRAGAGKTLRSAAEAASKAGAEAAVKGKEFSKTAAQAASKAGAEAAVKGKEFSKTAAEAASKAGAEAAVKGMEFSKTAAAVTSKMAAKAAVKAQQLSQAAGEAAAKTSEKVAAKVEEDARAAAAKAEEKAAVNPEEGIWTAASADGADEVSAEITSGSFYGSNTVSDDTAKEDDAAKEEEKGKTLPPENAAPAWHLKIAVEIGMTNASMAWKVCRRSADGCLIPAPQYNREDHVIRCPAALVLKKDNPGHPALALMKEEFAAGRKAMELACAQQPDMVFRIGLLHRFLAAPENSPEEKEAGELLGIFLMYLHLVYEEEIRGALPHMVSSDMDEVVHILMPEDAGEGKRERIRFLAAEAGFGRDGSACLVDPSADSAEYMLRMRHGDLEAISVSGGYRHILFLEIGALDARVELLRTGDPGGIQRISQAAASVSGALAGSRVDRALFDYLMDHRCLLPAFAEEAWKRVAGRELFRRLKENNNSVLKNGGTVATLGTIPAVFGDPDEEEFPEHKYKDYRITKEIYETQICGSYIETLCRAVRSVLAAGGIREEEVDAAFVTGGGGRLYYVPETLLGWHGSDPLRLSRIRQDPNSLFAEEEGVQCAVSI